MIFANLRWLIAQWFEKHWWKSYLRHKTPTNYLEWKRNYWEEFLQTTEVSIHEEERVLDAGCGPSGIFMAMSQPVTAVDPLLSTYRQLPHFNPENFPQVEFIQTTIEGFNQARNFDKIFCLNVINHVQNYNQSLDSLLQTLRHGGTLVLSIDCHNFPAIKWLFQLLPLDILHPHQHSLHEYESHLTSRGIRVLRNVLIKRGFLFDYYAIVGEKA